MREVSADQLQQAIEVQHHCHARLAHVEAVSEEFSGERVWEGLVHVFDLEGHPNATRAYAWSSPIEGSERRKFYAVLHAGPITSAGDAVRAAIVADHRNRGDVI